MHDHVYHYIGPFDLEASQEEKEKLVCATTSTQGLGVSAPYA